MRFSTVRRVVRHSDETFQRIETMTANATKYGKEPIVAITRFAQMHGFGERYESRKPVRERRLRSLGC